jgi:hypothetical protein
MTLDSSVCLRALVVLAGTGLGGCAASPEIGAYADGDPRSARLLLEDVNRSGPMPVVVRGPIPGNLTAPAVVDALASEIVGTAPYFSAMPEAPTDRGRVILVFGPPDQMSPWKACDPATPEASGFGEARRLAAFVCDGPSTVAHLRAAAASDSAEDVVRLMREVGRNLFPDPYAGRYGSSGYGGYGGFGSFGAYGGDIGVGVGIGLGF